jgi:hypothetical protein
VVAAECDEDRGERVPQLVRRHAAWERVLAAASSSSALQRGFEHALVGVVLVATATASRRKQQIVQAAGVTGLVFGEDVVKDRQ